MTLAYTRQTGRRAWYVPSLSVWGNLSAASIEALATETDDNETRIVFYRFDIGGELQEIPFDTLTDHRGNTLPSTIHRPVVMTVPKNGVSVAVVGRPTDSSFRAAKTGISSEDGLVDLWVVEAGE